MPLNSSNFVLRKAGGLFMGKHKKEAQWYDRKRTFLGLPLSFTKYYVLNEKLVIETGFFNLREEEIRLYRILDITLHRSLGQRMLGIGTIHICSADKTTPEIDIKNIKKPRETKELISSLVEEIRNARRVSGREYMGGGFDNDDFDHVH